RASMDSVKAVPKLEVFSADMGPRRRSSSRSSVIARQTNPRPYFAMKLMASGVMDSAAMVRSPSFSRSSSSTTTIMRPARISSIAVGTSQNGEVGVIGAKEIVARKTINYSPQRHREIGTLSQTPFARPFCNLGIGVDQANDPEG